MLNKNIILVLLVLILNNGLKQKRRLGLNFFKKMKNFLGITKKTKEIAEEIPK